MVLFDLDLDFSFRLGDLSFDPRARPRVLDLDLLRLPADLSRRSGRVGGGLVERTLCLIFPLDALISLLSLAASLLSLAACLRVRLHVFISTLSRKRIFWFSVSVGIGLPIIVGRGLVVGPLATVSFDEYAAEPRPLSLPSPCRTESIRNLGPAFTTGAFSFPFAFASS